MDVMTYLGVKWDLIQVVDPLIGCHDGISLLRVLHHANSLDIGVGNELLEVPRMDCVEHIEEECSVWCFLLPVLIWEIYPRIILTIDHGEDDTHLHLIQLRNNDMAHSRYF